jgi:hypothetical protein
MLFILSRIKFWQSQIRLSPHQKQARQNGGGNPQQRLLLDIDLYMYVSCQLTAGRPQPRAKQTCNKT